MNPQSTARFSHDQLGQAIALRLSEGSANMEHDILERLRIARQQAVAHRRMADARQVSAIAASGGAATLHFDGDAEPGWWGRLASALPLLALVAGLLTIYIDQNDNRANEVAEIDAALLTDDLPPAAYADPGFMQFLQAERPLTPP